MWHFDGDDPALSRPEGSFGDGCATGDLLDWNPILTRQGVVRATAYIPENHTDSYQYPLVCYLHRNHRSEQDIENWFPAISEANYLALGIRAPFPHRRGLPRQYRWLGRRPDASRGVIEEGLAMLAETHAFHPDRMTLFGEGEGALAALQQFLLGRSSPFNQEMTFAGVICHELPACWPRLLPPVTDGMTGRILLLDNINSGEMLAAVDGLMECGLEVIVGGRADLPLPRRIDHWLMSAISTTIW